MSFNESHRVHHPPIHHGHVAGLLFLLILGMIIIDYPVQAARAPTITLQPSSGERFEVGAAVPVDVKINNATGTTQIYIFLANERIPLTHPGSEDQIFYDRTEEARITVSTEFTPHEEGTYYLIVFITDAATYEYYTEPVELTIVDSSILDDGGNETSSSISTNTNSGNTANGYASVATGGPGGAVASAGGEKEYFGYDVPAYTPLVIPFHRPHQHGIEKIVVISSRPTQQNAIILDQHNHTKSNPPGRVYKFVELTHTHPWEHESIDFTVYFQVPRAWLLDYALAPRNVAMYQFSNGWWNKMDTQIIELKDGIVHYAATSDSIYPMVIVADRGIRTPFQVTFNPFESE